MLKKRKMKISDRGLYFQDNELRKTKFQIGSHYKYIIDVKSKKIVIVGSDNKEDNTVSKRSTKEGQKPVIDIRSKGIKEILGMFKESKAQYLQVTISDNKITIEEFQEEKSTFRKAKLFFNKITGKSKKVTSITDIMAVKKIAEIEMSTKQLQNVVGYEQIAFNFDYNYSSIPEGNSFISGDLETNLKNIDIPLKILSLYSGCGMFDKGFLDTGFKIAFATDISKEACITYSKNIGDHILNADITELDLGAIPHAPIVIGCTPCVVYSNSNRRTNLNKKLNQSDRILDIPDNILMKKYIEAIQKNPECILFVHENVGQVNTIGEGQLIEEIRQELSDFEITTKILNASDFGTPQNRSRSIIIGSKIGKIDLPKSSIHAVKTVRQALEGLTEKTPNQLDYSKAKPLTLQRMKHVKPGGNVFDIPEEIRPSGKHSDYFKRIEYDKPSITIVNPRKSMLLHPEENRILSVRECARIQGLPDNFIFHGTLASKQLQVCNGVPYQLSLAIAKKIKEVITKWFSDINNSKLSYSL